MAGRVVRRHRRGVGAGHGHCHGGAVGAAVAVRDVVTEGIDEALAHRQRLERRRVRRVVVDVRAVEHDGRALGAHRRDARNRQRIAFHVRVVGQQVRRRDHRRRVLVGKRGNLEFDDVTSHLGGAGLVVPHVGGANVQEIFVAVVVIRLARVPVGVFAARRGAATLTDPECGAGLGPGDPLPGTFGGLVGGAQPGLVRPAQTFDESVLRGRRHGGQIAAHILGGCLGLGPRAVGAAADGIDILVVMAVVGIEREARRDGGAADLVVHRHRRVVDRGDVDVDDLGGGSAVAVVHRHREAVGAVEVRVRRVGEGAVGVDDDATVGGVGIEAEGERIAVGIGGLDGAADGYILTGLDGGDEKFGTRRGQGGAGDGAVKSGARGRLVDRRRPGDVLEIVVQDEVGGIGGLAGHVGLDFGGGAHIRINAEVGDFALEEPRV